MISGSYAYYCENIDFENNKLNSFVVVEGYVVHKIKGLDQINKILTFDRCNSDEKCNKQNINEEMFYRKYSSIEKSVSIFVTRSHSLPDRESDIIVIEEMEFPDLKLGEKYILFLIEIEGRKGFYADPCSVVPLSSEPTKDHYFFKQKPGEILDILRAKNKK